MSDMVERVARAFWQSLYGDRSPWRSDWNTMAPELRAAYCGAACAAIAAMRGDDVPVFEDISNMDKEWKQSALPADVLNAGECACWDNGGRPFGYNGVTNIWRAMIDAALKGDKP